MGAIAQATGKSKIDDMKRHEDDSKDSIKPWLNFSGAGKSFKCQKRKLNLVPEFRKGKNCAASKQVKVVFERPGNFRV